MEGMLLVVLALLTVHYLPRAIALMTAQHVMCQANATFYCVDTKLQVGMTTKRN